MECGAGVLSEQPHPFRSQTGATPRTFEAGLLSVDSDSHISPLVNQLSQALGGPMCHQRRQGSEKVFGVQSCCPALPVGFRCSHPVPPPAPGEQSQPLPSSREVIFGGSDLSPGKQDSGERDLNH